MKTWTCIENCGACCKLDLHERENILNVLNENDINLLKKMVGKDGWCKHLDKKNKKCKIYNKRPHFCKVSEFSQSFQDYLINGDKFLINCCKQHISSIYGKRSTQMETFKKSISN